MYLVGSERELNRHVRYSLPFLITSMYYCYYYEDILWLITEYCSGNYQGRNVLLISQKCDFAEKKLLRCSVSTTVLDGNFC